MIAVACAPQGPPGARGGLRGVRGGGAAGTRGRWGRAPSRPARRRPRRGLARPPPTPPPLAAPAGGDLDPSTTAREVQDLFSAVGPCTVTLRRGPRRNHGTGAYAYVAFADAAAASAAVVRRWRLHGRALRVMPRATPSMPPPGGPSRSGMVVQLRVRAGAGAAAVAAEPAPVRHHRRRRGGPTARWVSGPTAARCCSPSSICRARGCWQRGGAGKPTERRRVRLSGTGRLHLPRHFRTCPATSALPAPRQGLDTDVTSEGLRLEACSFGSVLAASVDADAAGTSLW